MRGHPRSRSYFVLVLVLVLLLFLLILRDLKPVMDAGVLREARPRHEGQSSGKARVEVEFITSKRRGAVRGSGRKIASEGLCECGEGTEHRIEERDGQGKWIRICNGYMRDGDFK